MTDWLDIGSSPPGEDCAQVGSDNYRARARRECNAYIHLLRRALGSEPIGAELRVRSSPHDFGSYLSVACYFNPESKEAVDYAYRCEGDGPGQWDAEAKKELESRMEVPDGRLD